MDPDEPTPVFVDGFVRAVTVRSELLPQELGQSLTPHAGVDHLFFFAWVCREEAGFEFNVCAHYFAGGHFFRNSSTLAGSCLGPFSNSDVSLVVSCLPDRSRMTIT